MASSNIYLSRNFPFTPPPGSPKSVNQNPQRRHQGLILRRSLGWQRREYPPPPALKCDALPPRPAQPPMGGHPCPPFSPGARGFPRRPAPRCPCLGWPHAVLRPGPGGGRGAWGLKWAAVCQVQSPSPVPEPCPRVEVDPSSSHSGGELRSTSPPFVPHQAGFRIFYLFPNPSFLTFSKNLNNHPSNKITLCVFI